MPKQPLVSIIMNCYNSETYLKEAIQSVLNQTYGNFEVIFWDNQSIDKSAQIVQSYNDVRIKYFYAPQHTFLGKARNLAIEKCNGEWIGFLDCDDMWHKNKLSSSFELYNQHINKESVSLIYSKSLIIDTQNNIINENNACYSGMIHDKLLTKGNFVTFSSILVKKNILINSGQINETLNYCEDYDLLIKMTKNHYTIAIDKFLTFYRVHDKSLTSTKTYEHSIEAIDYMINYSKENKQELLVQALFTSNITYRVSALFLKLLLMHEFRRSLIVLKKYPYYMLFSPFTIPKIALNKF